jgi:hypothetical protein
LFGPMEIVTLQSVYWLGYRLDGQGLIPCRGWDFNPHLCVQIGSGPHPAFYLMGRVHFPNWLHNFIHLMNLHGVVLNEAQRYVFMAFCLVNQSDNFIIWLHPWKNFIENLLIRIWSHCRTRVRKIEAYRHENILIRNWLPTFSIMYLCSYCDWVLRNMKWSSVFIYSQWWQSHN